MTTQPAACDERGPMRTVIFHRESMWYPLDLPQSDDLATHAKCNPGTVKITDARTGEVLWPTH